MPQIREFIAQGDAGLGSPPDIGRAAGEIAGGLYKGIGSGLHDIGEALQRYGEQQETSQLHVAASHLHSQSQDDLQALKDSGDILNPDAVQKYQDDYANKFQSLTDNITSPAVRAHANEIIGGMIDDVHNRARTEQSIAAGEQAVADTKETVANVASSAYKDGSFFEDATKFVDPMVAAQGLPKGMVPKAQQAAHNQIANATIDGMVDRAAAIMDDDTKGDLKQRGAMALPLIQQALKDIESGRFGDALSPAQAEAARRRLTGEESKINHAMKTGQGADFMISRDQLPAVIDRTLMDGDPRGDGQKILDGMQPSSPEQIAEKYQLQQRYDAAKAANEQAKTAPTLPEPELQKRINILEAERSQAQPGAELNRINAQLGAARTIQEQRNKAYHQDPVTYLNATNSAIGAAFKKYQDAPSAQTFAAWAALTTAEQKRLYPNELPTVINPQIIAEAKGAVAAITDNPQGAQIAAKALAQMAQTYGSYWPSIVSSLQKANVLNGEQVIAASMYSNPKEQGMAETVLRASALTTQQRYDIAGVSADAARKAAITALKSFTATLGNANDKGEWISSFTDALTHVLQYTGDASAGNATAVAKRMVLDEYQFLGPNNSVRAPANLDGTAISRGLQLTQGDLTKYGIIVPPSYSGLRPTVQSENYIQHLQSTGRWYTNADGTGAILYDDAGNAVPHRKDDGTIGPVEMKWDDLISKGRANPTIYERGKELIFGKRAEMSREQIHDVIGGIESGHNPAAISKTSTAKGDMQVLEGTRKNPGYGVTPAKNDSAAELTRVGVDYFSAMLHKFGNPLHAAAAYMWGPGNAEKWVKAGAVPSQLPNNFKGQDVSAYVRKVAKKLNIAYPEQ